MWPWFAVFVKHRPIGDNHLKIFKKSVWKEAQKRLPYLYFDSLIPAVFYAVKIFTF